MHRLQVHKLLSQLESATPKVLILVLLIALLTPVYSVRLNFHAQAAQSALPEHVAPIAYYSLKDDWDSTLTLNNAASEPVNTAVVLYSINGKAWQMPEILIQAHDSTTIRLREFANSSNEPNEFQEGSLEVHFNSLDGMAIAPQLTVSASARQLSFDLEPPMHFKSSRLEGLWWSFDKTSSGQVMLCNTTGQNLDASVNMEWEGSVIPALSTSLAAHQTRVLKVEELLQNLQIDAKGIASGGLSITHSGAPGALIAAGVVMSQKRNLASNLNFIDPAAEKVSALDATGVLIGHPAAATALPSDAFFTPKLLLKNIADVKQTATVKMNISATGKFKNKAIPPIKLAPHEVRAVDLSRLSAALSDVSVEGAGIALEHTGEPGSLVASLCSLDEAHGLAADAPFVSRRDNSSEGGNHPFALDEASRSVAYLTNITAKPTKVTVVIFHEGGFFAPELIKVEAGATVTLDLLKMRDEQVKDIQGRTLPREMSKGQVFWHPHEGEALIGRVVKTDRATHTTSNFGCPNCCIQEPFQFDITPDPMIGVVGAFFQMQVMEWDSTCGTLILGPYNVTNACTYMSNNTGVATVNATGGVTLMGLGSTDVVMSITYSHSFASSAEDCSQTEVTENHPCPVAARPKITIANNEFEPASVTITDPDHNSSIISADISADPTCALPECLKPGDFVVVQINVNTSGGNFSYEIVGSGTDTQTQLVSLMLGSAVNVGWKVTANSGTQRPKNYNFTVRVTDVRHPTDPQAPPNLSTSTSILQSVILDPTNGGGAKKLMVN